MNYIINCFVLFFFLFSICLMLPAQICNCNISEVENNTVNSCNLIIGDVITVTSTTEFTNAINLINSDGGNKTILIADGVYPIVSPTWFPYITASNVVFRSLSGNRDAVIITGSGMTDVSPDTEHGFYCVGNNITIADLTIKEIGNHGIATQGDSLFVHNVKIQNTFEQMLKGTSAGDGSDHSIVQCSLFEYPNGVGPQFYIGGLDIHKGDNWLVRDNIFKNIASPSQTQAEHAIHFWNFSSNNTVERNWIINCDRGIGFGLGSSPNDGGIIRNNMIYNDGSGLFDDVGIGLETSPNTKVYNNTVYVSYQNAIEYRFSETNNVYIANNLTNKPIKSRNEGQAVLTSNNVDAQDNWFTNLPLGNLRIISEISTVTDQGTDLLSDVTMDIDKVARPQGNAYDIGASEYASSLHAQIVIWLEGSKLSNGVMVTDLLDLSLLPTVQPFNQSPWFYEGTETLPIQMDNIVDWVLVELRTGTPNVSSQSTIIEYQQAALILSDGSIVGVDNDNNQLSFYGLVENQEYYITIRHRNHLDVLSSTPIVFNTNSMASYDFTSDINQAFGQQQLKEMSNGKYALYAGDFNGDGIIQNTDYDLWKTTPAVLSIYGVADGNLDGLIQITDYDVWFPNKAKIGTTEIQY